jgi:hypothetical protein
MSNTQLQAPSTGHRHHRVRIDHFYSGAPPLANVRLHKKIIMVEIFQYPFVSGVMIVKFKNLICTYDPLEARMARVILYDYFL